MGEAHDPRLIAKFRWASRAASVLVAAVSVIVLLGWALDVEALKAVLPGKVAMNPGGTAIGFLLCGAALWLSQSSPSLDEASSLPRSIPIGLAFLVVLLAVIRIAGYQWGFEGGPDRWLFREKLDVARPPWRRERLRKVVQHDD